MKINSVYSIGKIRLEPGERLVSITTYRDHLIAITDRGTIYRVNLADF